MLGLKDNVKAMSPCVSPLHGEEPAAALKSRRAVPPLLDISVLRELEDEVKEPLIRNFVRDYLAMWEHRRQRLATALALREGRDQAIDAIISIRVSSAMIGGGQLTSLAAILEDQIREGPLPPDGTALADLIECGQATIEELRLRYLDAA